MFEDHEHISAVPDFLDNPAAEIKGSLLTGSWRRCSDGKSFVRTVPKGSAAGSLGPISADPYQGKPRPGQNATRLISNLVVHRWFVPNPDAAEEAELVRLAQLGDKRAAFKLVQCFHGRILKLAGKRRGNYLLGVGASRSHTNELFDELIATAFLEFWECVCTFKPELGYRLATHCSLPVAGAISDEAKRYRKRGIAGETLFQRIAFSRPYYPEITYAEGKRLKKRYRSLPGALLALKEVQKEVDHWIQPFSYSTTDGDDDNAALKGKLLANDGADDRAQNESEPTAGTGYTCFDNRRHQYAPHFRKHECYSRLVDSLAQESARRDARRLKAIGRPAYALELVAKDRRKPAAPDYPAYLSGRPRVIPLAPPVQCVAPVQPDNSAGGSFWNSSSINYRGNVDRIYGQHKVLSERFREQRSLNIPRDPILVEKLEHDNEQSVRPIPSKRKRYA
jgi:hypothetical protein